MNTNSSDVYFDKCFSENYFPFVMSRLPICGTAGCCDSKTGNLYFLSDPSKEESFALIGTVSAAFDENENMCGLIQVTALERYISISI